MSTIMAATTPGTQDVLYDMPVSNHGARIRFIIQSKGIKDSVVIKSPFDIGGLKSDEYLKLNPQGKMPLMLCSGKYPLPESDPIARYILDKYRDHGPSFVPSHIMQRALSEQLCRTLDLYIGPVQGCMYKPPGYIYSVFGSDRKAALEELKTQINHIGSALETFAFAYPELAGDYLCGSEVSLADAALFPTMVFCEYMLPQFFQTPKDSFMGPRLLRWWEHLIADVPAAVEVREEIVGALDGWKSKGRWDPILAEMMQE